MPRRYNPPKRIVEPDPRYNNVHVSMFVNRMMKSGKKSTAANILYKAMELIEQRAKKDPVEIFEAAGARRGGDDGEGLASPPGKAEPSGAAQTARAPDDPRKETPCRSRKSSRP